MSSSIQYNPVPPRVWSRAQNPCSAAAYKNDDPNANNNFARAEYERQMLLKGNILQYKKNSSNLTKKQRYTQIAKGMWTNRTKTWATQSATYTNPNTSSLLRVNSITLDPSNNIFNIPPNPFGCPTISIQDRGNLVCNVVVNPCTQEVIKRTKSQQLCNPTTDSDVPGQIQALCWNDGTQTWYPRQRYIMPTSGTKWPQGYKGFVSALTPAAPVLTLDSINNDSVTLSWTVINNICIPITNFNIYNNGVLVKVVPYTSLTTTIFNLDNCSTNIFYVTSVSNKTESEPSNDVEAFINIPYGPIITSITSTCNGGIILNWEAPNSCFPVINYNIYQDNIFLVQTGPNTLSYNVTSLSSCKTYSFYITAIFSDLIESFPSNLATTDQDPCPPVISATATGNGQVTINWIMPTTICTILSYTIYQTGYSSATYTNATSPYIINGLINGQTYNFYAISVGLDNSSINSNSVSVTLTIPYAPTITFIDACYKEATISWTEPSQNPPISYYTIYQTGYSTQTITPVVSNPYTVTGLTNGQTYNFSVSATNSYGIESAQSSIYSLNMPLTSTYFSIIGGSGSVSGSNYIISFASNGSLIYNSCNTNINSSVLLVGGGGGGGSGFAIIGTPTSSYSGGGGGGGGGVKTSSLTIPNNSTINISIGSGGNGGAQGGNDGTNGSSTSISGSSISTLTATGGSYGSFNTFSGGAGGAGGNGDTNGNGGAGGNGAFNGSNAGDGGNGYNGYSGGGGGGGSYLSASNYKGGASGGNGIGGQGNGNSSLNGEDATAYGGGGGGGFGDPNLYKGGNGFSGFVQFTIPN